MAAAWLHWVMRTQLLEEMSLELPRFGDRRRMAVGLLGGSFNPAHAGHVHIARLALRRLALDQVWLLVSPGNPLKRREGMASLTERLSSARRIADGRRIVATTIERQLGTRFTLHTIRALQRRFPRVRFVWLMGADNLRQFPHWRGWMRIARAVPFAVLPRPTYTRAALASQAARRLARFRRPGREASLLSGLRPPAWVVLAGRENTLSATLLRRVSARGNAAGEDRSPESQQRPKPQDLPNRSGEPRKYLPR